MSSDRADPIPGGCIEMFEKPHMTRPHIAEFFDEFSDRNGIVARHAGVDIFVERREVGAVPPGDGESAVTENTFGVDNMAQHFADAPFSLGVPMSRFIIRETGKCGSHMRFLSIQDRKYVIFFYYEFSLIEL